MHDNSVVAAHNLLMCCDKQASAGSPSLEPHFGSHAAATVATQLSQWLTRQPSIPSIQSALDALEHTFSVSVACHHIYQLVIHSQCKAFLKQVVHLWHRKQAR